MGRTARIAVLSDFNVGTFEALLANDPAAPELQPVASPFGQYAQALLDPSADVWAAEPDVAVVWTRPQAVSPSFGALLRQEPADLTYVEAEVDGFLDLLERLRDRVSIAFVPTWTLPPRPTAFPSLDMGPDGAGAALLRMNHRLVERGAGLDRLRVLDASSWLQGTRPINPKLWYLGKTPFGSDVFQAAMATIKGALRGLHGYARKLVVLDLDDTLWGGIVGEVGREGLRLGGHDPVGEAFVHFQEALRALTRRGVLLGVVSKNDESVALEAFREHPEMVLGLEDLAGWRIDWTDKAASLAALADELNLGLQSVVFIDDSPIERARVAEALPEVLVPDWPGDPMLYVRALHELGCFDNPSPTDEDRARTALYVTERERRASQDAVGSLDDWLASLDIVVQVEPLGPDNLARSAQLLNKTNQMNLTTRRLSEAELAGWAEGEGRAVWAFRVSDRFGDLGLTALVGVEREGGRLRIVDWLLSCRVMGRKVEETMVAVAVAHARALGLETVVACHEPTAKNGPCLRFWQRSGFATDEAPGVFRWDARTSYPVPEVVRLTGFDTGGAAGAATDRAGAGGDRPSAGERPSAAERSSAGEDVASGGGAGAPGR